MYRAIDWIHDFAADKYFLALYSIDFSFNFFRWIERYKFFVIDVQIRCDCNSLCLEHRATKTEDIIKYMRSIIRKMSHAPLIEHSGDRSTVSTSDRTLCEVGKVNETMEQLLARVPEVDHADFVVGSKRLAYWIAS